MSVVLVTRLNVGEGGGGGGLCSDPQPEVEGQLTQDALCVKVCVTVTHATNQNPQQRLSSDRGGPSCFPLLMVSKPPRGAHA